MSTLTKVLVVLVSLIAIFLCGMVVTYVANSSNYKALYEQQNSARQIAEADRASAMKQYDEQLQAVKKMKDDYNDRIQRLEDAKAQLESNLRTAERESAKHLARADSWQGILTGMEQSLANLEASLSTAQKELDSLRTDRTQEKKELNEVTAQLYETIVQMQALSADKRRLMEENTSLEGQLQKAAGGKAAVTSAGGNVVTREKNAAIGVGRTSDVSLSGLITEIGESLVSVSIGSADGVKDNMVFHVTRGDEFICDIVITDVDVNKAAGVLELKLREPRVGDTISTKL